MTTDTTTPAIDHTYTDEIVCPYCGLEHSDSWDVRPDSGEFKCEECGKRFHYERDISVTYSTSEITQEAQHGEN